MLFVMRCTDFVQGYAKSGVKHERFDERRYAMERLSLTDKMIVGFVVSAVGGVVAWLALVGFMIHMTPVQVKEN